VDESQYVDRDQRAIWFSVLNMRRWEIVMQDIKLDEMSIYTGESKKSAVLDSFYSKIGLPQKEFEEFKKIAITHIPTISCTADKNDCTFPQRCSDQVLKMPNLYIQLGTRDVFNVPKKHYMTDIKIGNYPGCRIEITNSGEESVAILGTPFLYNYYGIYDLKNSRAGLFAHKSSEGTITKGGVDRSVEDSILPGWAIFVIIAGVVGLVAIIGIFIYVRMRNKRLQN
jgi:hypothetical protein